MTNATDPPPVPLVLVGDDEPEIREIVCDVLGEAGYRTVSATDGEEVLELARAHRPRLIVLDVMMPGMDGYTTLTRLRGVAETRDIPVVILTGQDPSRYTALSAGLGAVAHVPKPFSAALLVDAVRHALAGPTPGVRGPAPSPPAEERRVMEAEADPTGVAQVYALLLGALGEGASEFHVEPLAQDVRVRNRIGGRLVERGRFPRALLAGLISRFRLLAGLHDEDGPQDAYVRTRLEGQEVELELAFGPTLHGEAVTVRLWRGGLAEIDPILGTAVATNASDVYLIEGTPPTLKVDGVAAPLPETAPLGGADMQKLLRRLVPEGTRKEFEATGEADLSFVHPEFGRFRLNCYRAMGAIGMVLRRVKTEVPTFEALELPPILGELVMERQGLLLLVGATGSGKSTTLAAMIDHRNAHAAGHIVTVEDPVEFIHPRKRSVVSQREVGIDTGSYLVALQKALRQAPDVILVGELRDHDTVATALHAAETGHLVLSTLHATNTTSAIERLLNFFPTDAREAVLMQISLLLRAIVAQRLVPRAEGKGRVAAQEILLNTPRVQALIRRGELESIRQALEEGLQDGLQTMDQGLLQLYLGGKITQDDALRFADSPNNVRLRLRGIR